ncbi:MAG: DUF6754 domain-containing protein [Candidatus Promineifilaceae bacterium]
MDISLNHLIVTLFIALAGAGLFVLTRRVQQGRKVGLRPHSGYSALQKQVGRSVESGQRMHVSLGRGNLSGPAAVSSVAALTMLDHLAEGSCASDMPPVVTAGDGTLLIAGQDQVRQAYHQAHRQAEYRASVVQFQASETFPLVLGVGVNHVLNSERLGNNILTGRFGAEIALMTEAGERAQMEQLISSDDPVALAIAYPVTTQVIIGEDHLAAGAFLQRHPAQLASLQLQDILRLLVAGTILLTTFWGIIAAFAR